MSKSRNINNLKLVSIYKIPYTRVKSRIQYNKNNLKSVTIYKIPYQHKLFESSIAFLI